ncbi:hypothetical protein ACFLQN_03805 [Candidatus Aenigmatarchaeota archaeon]
MKGIFLGMSIILLSLVLLLISQITLENIIDEGESVSRFSVFDRITDEKRSIENGFKDILRANNVTIVSNSTFFSIKELSPNPQYLNFSNATGIWKNFTENNSDFDIKINITEINQFLPLRMNNIKYSHPKGFGYNKTEITNASIVDRYIVFLDLSDKNGAIKATWLQESAGSDRIIMFVKTGNETMVDSKLLDFSQQSLINITIQRIAVAATDVENNTIYVTIGNPSDDGYLSIENVYNIYLNSEINMSFPPQVTNAVYLSEESINITSTHFNISSVVALRVD